MKLGPPIVSIEKTPPKAGFFISLLFSKNTVLYTHNMKNETFNTETENPSSPAITAFDGAITALRVSGDKAEDSKKPPKRGKEKILKNNKERKEGRTPRHKGRQKK